MQSHKNLIINEATFIASNDNYLKCPAPNLPEIAFIGRSNVGKSSLINMLTQRKSLAKISATPGKTQTINHFLIDKKWYLVDLPGYGWAKVSQSSRKNWEKMIWDYISKRENLHSVVVLIDSRLEPQKIDLAFIQELVKRKRNFFITFTKGDKNNTRTTQQNADRFLNTLLEFLPGLPPFFITSSETQAGRTEMLEFMLAEMKN